MVNNLNLEVSNQQSQIDSKDAQINNLTSTVDTQQSQIDLKDAQIDRLDSLIAHEESIIIGYLSQIHTLESQYASSLANYTQLMEQYEILQSQLLNATALIAQLQGPTGILPVYMDLANVGPLNGGAYFLQLSLKNTGTVPITQVFVTLDSVQITMTFTYLNTTISADTPLPSYQTATGRQNVSPPIMGVGTYPLIIQAIATNGTIYTYQTTITSHV